MLKILQNIHEQIRRNKQLYIDSDKLNETYLLELLAKDARLLGAGKMELDLIDDWHVIYTENNWMNKNYNNFSLEALFEKFCPLPERGVNAIRSEVIASAFSKHIFIKDGKNVHVIKGETPSKEVLNQSKTFNEYKFWVGLKL